MGSAILNGLSSGFFWTPYHQYLALRTEKGNRGKTIATLWIITSIATISAPAIGGILLEKTGAITTLSIAAGIVFLSLIPLWKTKNVYTPQSCITKEIIHSLKNKKIRKFYLIGITGAGAGILWPLTFYLILQGYAALGIITFATSLISLIIARIAGAQHDKKESKKTLSIGTKSQAVMLLAKIIAINPIIATIIDAFDQIVRKIYWLGVDTESYKLREEDENHIVKREVLIHLGFITLFVFFAITESFTATFAFAAVASLFITKI